MEKPGPFNAYFQELFPLSALKIAASSAGQMKSQIDSLTCPNIGSSSSEQ